MCTVQLQGPSRRSGSARLGAISCTWSAPVPCTPLRPCSAARPPVLPPAGGRPAVASRHSRRDLCAPPAALQKLTALFTVSVSAVHLGCGQTPIAQRCARFLTRRVTSAAAPVAARRWRLPGAPTVDRQFTTHNAAFAARRTGRCSSGVTFAAGCLCDDVREWRSCARHRRHLCVRFVDRGRRSSPAALRAGQQRLRSPARSRYPSPGFIGERAADQGDN